MSDIAAFGFPYCLFAAFAGIVAQELAKEGQWCQLLLLSSHTP